MTPKRILIVEDSPTVVEQMKLFLRTGSYKVTHAGGEFGMYQMIEEYGKLVDLILMDLNLKNENGLDLISKLKENEKYADIPVIVVTEHARKDFILRARDLKVNDYIRKPFTKEIFLERVSKVLGIEGATQLIEVDEADKSPEIAEEMSPDDNTATDSQTSENEV